MSVIEVLEFVICASDLSDSFFMRIVMVELLWQLLYRAIKHLVLARFHKSHLLLRTTSSSSRTCQTRLRAWCSRSCSSSTQASGKSGWSKPNQALLLWSSRTTASPWSRCRLSKASRSPQRTPWLYPMPKNENPHWIPVLCKIFRSAFRNQATVSTFRQCIFGKHLLNLEV